MEEEWVRSQFEPMFQHIINMQQDKPNWTQVPRDVEYKIGKKKMVKVCYSPSYTHSIVDSAAWAEQVEKELHYDRFHLFPDSQLILLIR